MKEEPEGLSFTKITIPGVGFSIYRVSVACMMFT